MTTTQRVTLAPGARVEIRDEEWVVRSVKAEASGGQAVRVSGVSELVRGKDAIFLTALDEIRVLRPEETQLVPDTSSRYAKTRLYLESLLRRSPASDTAIHLGHLAATTPVDYQLRPTQRALSLLRPRFLMADGVGLGKTIEVGVMLTELIRRGRGRRILVVAKKSILAQFQEELWARFTIPLVRLDSVGIQRVQARIPSSMNPFHYFDRVIVSLDTLKNEVKYRQFLENCRWDAIVIDECQHVAMRTKGAHGQSTLNYQLARLLARQCEALILTSATPHDGSAESFASIIRHLEPTAIADDSNFTSDEVAHLIQRKFKKDVAHEIREAFPEREMSSLRVEASPQEDAFFECLQAAQFKTIDRKRGAGGVLFRTTLLKAFLSSPAACISTIDKRLQHAHLAVESLTGEALAAAEADRALLQDLRALAHAVTTFPKYRALLDRVRTILAAAHGRVVIFSERIQTLEFLRDSLARDLRLGVAEDSPKKSARGQIATFHGSLDDQSQMELVKSFGSQDSPIRILLASDAAAEGINLHFHCHHLIHFDLPWSLITLVQRNGRIDRFGQKETPFIDTLLTIPADSALQGDLRVLERLVEKEDQVQKNLGDAAWLMNLHSVEREEEAIASAVQGDVAAEAVLPDAPVTNAAGDDWFATLFGSHAPEPPVKKHPRRSLLFDTDLAFAREAFQVAVPNHSDTLRWQPAEEGFDLAPPPDLERRYDYLPSELTRGRKTFRLTIDRKRVMQSLELARQREGEWPEWELFWAHHPVCEWLDDQVLAALGRHEAWVVRVKPTSAGVPLSASGQPVDALFLFQGVFSNQLSQSVLVDWFAIPFRAGRALPSIVLDEALSASGLTEFKGNPATLEIPAALSTWREPAVEAARAHMNTMRLQRAEQFADPLRAGQRALKLWHDRTGKRLNDERLLASRNGVTTPVPIRKRIERETHDADEIYKERLRWIDQVMRTVSEPYLRLAAVFVRADFE
jgi:ERCC4-related helicase